MSTPDRTPDRALGILRQLAEDVADADTNGVSALSLADKIRQSFDSVSEHLSNERIRREEAEASAKAAQSSLNQIMVDMLGRALVFAHDNPNDPVSVSLIHAIHELS